MWAYDSPPSRRPRDMPPSSSRRYYGNFYDGQPYDAPPQASSSSGSHDRSRRGSVPVYIDQQDKSPTHSSSSRRANVIASDDGWDRAAYMRGGNAPPLYGRVGASRHDVEARTSEQDRRFRDKRGTYDTGEAENLRRAKSHSPRRAAKDDDYMASAATRRGRGQQYYDHRDPIHDYGKSRAATMPKNGGYEYGSSPPRITTGFAPPYAGQQPRAASPKGIDERVGGKYTQRGRENPYHGGGYDLYPERGAPQRDRDRRSRHMDNERPGWDDADYVPRSSRGVGRGGRAPPQPPVDDYGADPYGRGGGRPAPRYRQSVPPHARSRYDGGGIGLDDDPYAPPPRRRATSVSQGRAYGGGDGGRYSEREGPRERRYRSDDDEYEAPRSRGAGGGGGYTSDAAPAAGPTRKREKSKSVGKQAGKLFMTHAFPMIKQEAVPLLTKAAQAYFEQRK